MRRGLGQRVVLVCGRSQSAGEVRIERWTRQQRLLRAARTLLACWGLAVLSVLVPVAHFVLVPALLLAGPIAAFVVARQPSAIIGGQGPCPACGELLVVSRAAERWPLDEACEACHAQVTIERA